MGEAQRRKLAGKYPAHTTTAEEEAMLAEAFTTAVNDRVASWLAGHDVSLTDDERDEVDFVIANSASHFNGV